jgi:hypothetical protein
MTLLDSACNVLLTYQLDGGITDTLLRAVDLRAHVNPSWNP